MKSFLLLPFFICCCCYSFGQINLNQGLVAYYPFNGNANDASGNGNNPIFNNATSTNDRNGNVNSAYHFNGIDNYIEIPNSTSLCPVAAISVSAWVKPSGFYKGKCHGNRVLMKGDADFLTGNYCLTYDDNAYTSGNNCNNTTVDTIHQTAYGVCAGNTYTYIQKDNWYLLTYTYDGVNCRFYINCKLEAISALNSSTFVNAYNLFLGKMNNPTYPYWFNGDMDEVRIYNRALNYDEVLALNDVSKSDFTFTQNICNPKQITLKNEAKSFSKFYWNFGNGVIDSSNVQVAVNYSNNAIYDVSLITKNNFGCSDTVMKKIAINPIGDTNLIINKSDTSICSGDNFQIKVQDTGIAYCWASSNTTISSNTVNPIVSPIANTTYSFYKQSIANNLVINGDFESGNVGFQTDYNYHPATAGGVQGIYNINNNPNIWLSAFGACSDHTAGFTNDKMMMIDGSTQSNTIVWKQTLTIQPNTSYLLSAWATSIASQNTAQLQFLINDNLVGNVYQLSSSVCEWNKFSVTWNSGNKTSITIGIVNHNLQIQGNDFALDDISFGELLNTVDSIKVVVNNCPIINPNCKGVVKLAGHDKITPPQTNYKKYFPTTGFTWETWFNSNYYANTNTTVDTRNKLISALDIPQCQDIVLGFGWPQVAQKNTLCFVADGPNGCSDRDNTPCTYFPVGGFLPNTWYHVAAVRDYSNNTSKLYINGVLVDTKINNHSPLNPSSNILFPNFQIGTWSGIGTTDSGFAGKMDEIRIWNYPRTATEIQANYDKCLGGNETGLVAYYHSNEGKGSTLKDVSPNSNNATLSSSVTWDKTDNAPLKTTCYQSTFSVTNKIICYKDTFQNHTVSGVYKDTITNSYGCDSIITLNLTVLPIPTISKDTLKGCGQVVVNGVVYTTNTLLSSIIKNQLGCDSIIQQHQIIITTKHDTLTKQICSGQAFWGHTTSFDTTFALANNCDSILHVTIKNDVFIKDSITKSICNGEVYFGYNITGYYTDTFHTTSCDSIRVLHLIKSDNLQPKLQQDTSICDGDFVNLFPGSYQKYLWSTGSISSSIKVKDIGLYWVEVSDSIGCKARDSFTLTNVYTKPSNFLPNSLQVCYGELYTVNGYKNYNWITGATTPSINLNGLNNYWLQVTDNNNCKGSDTMKVSYLSNQNTNIISAFSPNGDGINDEFKPFTSTCLLQYELAIFNRWGQKVFSTTNVNKGWNGLLNGKPLPIDVYYYILKYTTVTGLGETKSGYITLLR